MPLVQTLVDLEKSVIPDLEFSELHTETEPFINYLAALFK